MMDPIALLPMYSFSELRGATDRLWTGIAASMRTRGIAAPKLLSPDAHLNSDDLIGIWKGGHLLFGQTCGYPYVSKIRRDVTLIGTPDYGIIPGKPGWYNSAVIVRTDDPRTRLDEFDRATFAYNETGSQSGCQAMMYTILQKVGAGRLFGKCVMTGAHRATTAAIAGGLADIGAVDTITWRYLKANMPETAQLRVLMFTEPTPGLPYVASNRYFTPELTDAVSDGISALDDADRKTLGLQGLWRSSDKDYDLIARNAALSAEALRAHGLDDRM